MILQKFVFKVAVYFWVVNYFIALSFVQYAYLIILSLNKYINIKSNMIKILPKR